MGAGLEYTRRLLQPEPLHTNGNCQLIRLYSLGDHRPAALQAYQAYARTLKRELDLRHDQETQALGEYTKHQNEKDDIPTASDARTPLVGRLSEWWRLLSIWQRAATGSPQAVFGTGEAEIGWTRLVEELVRWVSRQGIRIAVAHCFPAEGACQGAGLCDPAVERRAIFGFFSKYRRGASVPTGRTHFRSQAGDLKFDSEVFRCLVVDQGGGTAQFKGSGQVNGGLDPNGNAYKLLNLPTLLVNAGASAMRAALMSGIALFVLKLIAAMWGANSPSRVPQVGASEHCCR